MIIDGATTRMLQSLPADLKARRWKIVRGESSVLKRVGGSWYKAVYMRLFEDGVDAEELAHYDKPSKSGLGLDQSGPEPELGRGISACTRSHARGGRTTQR